MKGRLIKLGGRQFEALRRSELPFPIDQAPGDFDLMLQPHHPPDDHLEFPANVPLEDAYSYVGSGLAAHEVQRTETKIEPGKLRDAGFAATDLIVFREDDWYGECLQVLTAHGWWQFRLSSEMVSKVAAVYGDSKIQHAKEVYGENWESYILEVAAVQLAKPLSRLWYAANMISLYFAHNDDLRLGFLWAEYQIKMLHEADSVRGKNIVRNSRAGGVERAKIFETSRRQIIRSITSYVHRGHSVANAASLTFKAGLGASAEANRKLWTRSRQR